MEPNESGSQIDCGELQTRLFQERSLIIAANRAPVTFERDDSGNLTFERGTGGLVTALSGLVEKINPTWIGCARTETDAEWKEGDVPLDQEGNSIFVHFLNPDPSAYEGYYNVIANPLLWFLQHSMWDVPRAPVINQATWKAWENGYKVVNRMFADEIVRRVRHSKAGTIVMLQDYHLYLAPGYIRRQLPPDKRPTTLLFVHIPWPGPEYWRILPPTMRQAILEGLCAADILGFQTTDDGLNFLRTAETLLPNVYVKYKRGRVWFRNHATYVRDFPISIDVAKLRELCETQEVFEYSEEIQELVGDRQLILRIDRVEPSKNIVRGFQAFEEMLDLYPQHLGQVKFLALLVPSRLAVEEYQEYLDEIMAAAGRINARYGDSDWEPVRILVGENYPRAVAALQLYDILLVNAIADGMNLVAKEGPIVNKHNGVLILSERAGAQQQLQSSALVISPCDIYATAEAIHQALTMEPGIREKNAERLRWLIERDDIDAWLCWQLDSIVELNL